jgi:nicotinate phosphoribosyltransferase
MTTSADVPYFDCAYKLVEYGGIGRRKLSKGKATWPGRKQVFRHNDAHGRMDHDILALDHEQLDGDRLIQHFMADGVSTCPLPSLSETRAYLQRQLACLPEDIDDPAWTYPVRPSSALTSFAEAVSMRMAGND